MTLSSCLFHGGCVSVVSIYLAYRLAEGNVTKRRVAHVLRILSTMGSSLAFNLHVTWSVTILFRYYIILCARAVHKAGMRMYYQCLCFTDAYYTSLVVLEVRIVGLKSRRASGSHSYRLRLQLVYSIQSIADVYYFCLSSGCAGCVRVCVLCSPFSHAL